MIIMHLLEENGMIIEMFNFWYFFWIIFGTCGILGLYFGLRKTSERTQKLVLFGFLVFGLLLHFLKVYIPPYSVDEARMLRDAWFVNICAGNIALFPFLFFSKNRYVKDYMKKLKAKKVKKAEPKTKRVQQNWAHVVSLRMVKPCILLTLALSMDKI